MVRLRRLGVVTIGAALLWSVIPGTAHAADGPPTLTSATVAPDGAVTLTWTDNSAVEDGFSVHRADSVGQFPGQWYSAGDLATRNRPGMGGVYTWTDRSSFTPAEGQRCYRVAAYDYAGGFDAISGERCLTAPQPQPAPPTSTRPTGTAAPKTAAAPGGSTAPGVTRPPGASVPPVTPGGSVAAGQVPGTAPLEPASVQSGARSTPIVSAQVPSRTGGSATAWWVIAAVLALGLVLGGVTGGWTRRRRRSVGVAVDTVAGTPATGPPVSTGPVAPEVPPDPDSLDLGRLDGWTPPPADPGLPQPVDPWA